jgi:hypothetical protein
LILQLASVVKAAKKPCGRKEVIHMTWYRIYRVYEVPGRNRIEATERMMEAIALGVERDYHVNDLVRVVGDPPNKSDKVSLDPPKGWLAAFLDQLLGRSEQTHKR